MRKIAAGIFVVLMLIFVLTSVDWNQFAAGGAVGKINGQRVDARIYQTAVQQAIDARQRQSSAALGLDDYAEIRNQVWEQFIQSTVLEEEYERRGITVSDDEIVDALRNSPPPEFMNVPDFQTDSQFDLGKYQRWLTSSVAQQYLPSLEAQYREQLRRAKLLQAITADIYLSDAALWERYRDQNETVKIALTAIIPRNVVPDSAVTTTPQEVEAYYKAHTDEFRRPRTAYLSYVTFPRVTNAADTAAARARADSIRAEILGGAPFAEVAQRESADSASAVRGGDLGEWTRGTMDPAFDSAAFSLPVKKLSPPVLSRYGFHLIEVTKRSGNKAEGRHILIPIELAGAHRDLVDAKADSLEELAADRPDPASLDTVARALRLPIGTASPVHENTRVQIGNLVVPDAGSWAFEAKVGSTSPVIESPWAYYVFRLDSLQEGGVPPVSAIRTTVEDALRNSKKWDAARKVAQNYLKQLEQGAPAAAAAKALNLPHREFGPFSRVNPPLASPVVVGAAFGLEAGQRSGVLEAKEGMYVIHVLERTKPDSAAFAKDLGEFRARAVNEARQERIRYYMEALRAAAKVVDRRNEVLQREQQPAEPPIL